MPYEKAPKFATWREREERAAAAAAPIFDDGNGRWQREDELVQQQQQSQGRKALEVNTNPDTPVYKGPKGIARLLNHHW